MPASMNHLPVFLNLRARRVLVVGGGKVALRKIEWLLAAGAAVHVVAKRCDTAVTALFGQDRACHLAEDFHPSHLKDMSLVVAATSDKALNRKIFHRADALRIFVNVVDDPDLCTFIFPSVVNRSPIQIAISSGGNAPALARRLREKLEASLPANLGEIASIAGRWRDRVRQALTSAFARRRFWEDLFDSDFVSLVDRRQLPQAERFLEDHMKKSIPHRGDVSLVGAGPGDAELLTLKGLQAIQRADVILYDRLVGASILALARRDAEHVFVGKRAGSHAITQARINELLVELAMQGKRVVRLKGGDPFVFGRGAEELETLVRHRIPFTIVPGVTAAIGAAAYAGIPLTHRQLAKGVTFVTGHEHEGGRGNDWQAIARLDHTLVIYMGAMNAGQIQKRLLLHGKSANTPTAIISNGTYNHQTVRTGTLAELAELAKQAELPALLVVGEVAALHPQFAWFGQTFATACRLPAAA